MNEYRLVVVASARKELRDLPSTVKERARAAIGALQRDPRPPGVRKLSGHERRYRIRVGDYRVVYEVDDAARVVDVIRVRHRRHAYD